MSFLRRNAVACTIAVLAAGVCVWVVTAPLALVQTKAPPAAGNDAELNQILRRYRDRPRHDSEEVLRADFDRWMADNVRKGATTRNQMYDFFGKASKRTSVSESVWYRRIAAFPAEEKERIRESRKQQNAKNLDRPLRDQILTLQYDLDGTYGNATYLVCDFDPQTGILQDWDISVAICGFCPHVLVNDGAWRLEGKMLAGCIGRAQEGTDSLVLPRLTSREGRLAVRLANWAPETEHIHKVELGIVGLQNDEELDVEADGLP